MELRDKRPVLGCQVNPLSHASLSRATAELNDVMLVMSAY